MRPLSIHKLASGILGLLVLGAGIALAAGAGVPTVHVSGNVTDGSGHGWPLFARIEMTSASTEPLVVYTAIRSRARTPPILLTRRPTPSP